MPKAEPHFDAPALVQAVLAQEPPALGLRVTTNNPSRFKAIIYKAAAQLGVKLHIYEIPARPNSLALLRDRAPKQSEPTDA